MPIGAYRHFVTLDAPGEPSADPDGGFTDTYAPLTPAAWNCAIAPASTRAMESIAAGAVLVQATHIVRGRYHAGITSDTRVTFNGRQFHVLYVGNPEERNIETVLVCAEVVA